MVKTRLLEIPVSVEPIQAIRAMRLIVESNNWDTTRIEDTKMVHRWAIIVPITSQARVIGFKINSNEVNNLAIRSWSQTPGSAGTITYVSFEIPQNIEGREWENILQKWIKLLPRCPWKWTFMEKSIIGYMIPEFRKSTNLFKKEGIDITSWEKTLQ
ncbi:MAG: hypothetical protein OR994_00420 [Candidatus Poseidoniales archaeon]|jgi:hypothetical protein|nr:hypothetical protein [Candidatus Poseidoniales archaeon]|tara:strand:- start:379 stop:849 length:471 start_codon:yes stop_codon:yes gene_type:complete